MDVLLRGPACHKGWSSKTNKGTEAKTEEKVMRQLDIFMEKSRIKGYGD